MLDMFKPAIILYCDMFSLFVEKTGSCITKLSFNFLIQLLVLGTISMFSILSVFSSTCLLYSHRADFAIQIGCFNSFGGEVGVKVELDEEVESFNHIRGVSAIVKECPGLMLDPTGKAGDSSISEWANGVGCCHSLDRLIGARDGFSKGNFMVCTSVRGLCHQLSEAWIDVKKELCLKVIFVTTTNEG